MTHVYTLKIRHSGEEDDVFVFSTRGKAEAHVFEYFEEAFLSSGVSWTCDTFQEYLFSEDVGYFDIERQEIL